VLVIIERLVVQWSVVAAGIKWYLLYESLVSFAKIGGTEPFLHTAFVNFLCSAEGQGQAEVGVGWAVGSDEVLEGLLEALEAQNPFVRNKHTTVCAARAVRAFHEEVLRTPVAVYALAHR
jgi:hypothetical protein